MHLAPRTLAALASAALCALAACGDAPTLPDSFAEQAGGKTWVAVSEPRGLPDAQTWLRWDSPSGAAEVRALLAGAAKAREAADLDAAMALESRARTAAASALAADPPAARLSAASSALREWETRAAERLASGPYPALAATAAAVSADRAEGDSLLSAGDLRGAAARFARAGEAARTVSPNAVALSLVASAERRIDADPDPSAGLRRARLLLRLSREALATGDQTRAMKRAWYALQLIDAEGKPAGS